MNEFPYKLLDKNMPVKKFVKFIIIGDGFVGKTGITSSFCEGFPSCGYQMTIGVNFGVRKISVNGNLYAIQLWDIAGQERFRIFRTQYYEGAHGVILVYDITNRLTFLDLENWVCEFQEYIGTKPLIIAGNKVDLPESGQINPKTGRPYEREVEQDEGREFAKSLDAAFYETSALKNINIDLIFANLLNFYEKNQVCRRFELQTYNTVEAGFTNLGRVILNDDYHKIYDAIIKLKHSIFSKNPYSIVLGNISEWISNLQAKQVDKDLKEKLIHSMVVWRNYHLQSLQNGHIVRSL
ncbi:MAG: Rab family GTPase [Candidatus Helarchaeota archaeon]